MGEAERKSLNDLDWGPLRRERRNGGRLLRRAGDFDHLRSDEPSPEAPILPFDSLDVLDNFVPFGRLR